jgi:cobalt-precorrin 5A hydrolase
MKLAVISLSEPGARTARQIAAALGAELFLPATLDMATDATRFARVGALSRELFDTYRGLIYVMPTGAVVRSIAPLLRSKLTDPAVVVVDVLGRWAVSLLSGHEGGANDLALRVANALGAEPVITTTTDAAKRLIVGVGCRRGMSGEHLAEAVRQALSTAGRDLAEVRLLATADVKRDEPGLHEAAALLGLPLRIIASQEIRASTREFEHSAFVEQQVRLPAVAEPAALLAGRRTSFILRRQTYQGVTVAIAEESCSSSG